MVPIFLAALLFYLVFPLAGAWRVRRNWERFRAAATEAASAPEVDFSLVQSEGPLPAGPFRLSGTLEAFEEFEEETRLWIGNERISCSVSLAGTPVFFLEAQTEPFGLGATGVRKAEASSLGALAEGTQFLVSGPLVRDRSGRVHFAAREGSPLLVLAFEGAPETALARAVYAGRAPVDHWNSWTPISLGFGFLSLLVLSYLGLRTPGETGSGFVGLALALLPSTFFLPPGILFFYAFARFWARGRDLRASLDRSILEGQAPVSLTAQRKKAWVYEAVAHGALGLGIILNAVILEMVLKLWMG